MHQAAPRKVAATSRRCSPGLRRVDDPRPDRHLAAHHGVGLRDVRAAGEHCAADSGRSVDHRPATGRDRDRAADALRAGHRPRTVADGVTTPLAGVIDGTVPGRRRPSCRAARRGQDRHHRTTPSTPGSVGYTRAARDRGLGRRPHPARQGHARAAGQPERTHDRRARTTPRSSARRSPAPIWAQIMTDRRQGTDTSDWHVPAERHARRAPASRHRQQSGVPDASGQPLAAAFGALQSAGFTARLVAGRVGSNQPPADRSRPPPPAPEPTPTPAAR